MRIFLNIVFHNTVYFVIDETTSDEQTLKSFSIMLKGKTAEHVFDRLYKSIRPAIRKWRQQFDVVDPFSSPEPRRSLVSTVWILDLDAGIVRFMKKDQSLYIPLNRFELDQVHFPDFQQYSPPVFDACTSRALRVTPRKIMHRLGLEQQQSQRRKALVYRLLSDFGFQWRHILCSRYNGLTFRKLASAIVRIATLDFIVQEEIDERTCTSYRHLVSDFDVPDWMPSQGPVVQVGTTIIIMAQHMPHAMEMLKGDLDLRQRYGGIPNLAPIDARSQTYLVISVKEMFLVRTSPQLQRPARVTEPVRLLDGINPLSSEAVDLLLEATQCPNLSTPMHKLPPELQNLILNKVSSGPIESSRIGCLLNLGSPFAWRRDGRDVEPEEIWFSNCPAGIAYK